MQCFKGAWISNVLHEGIGIPRISDAQGNLTLTGKDGGDLNGEASRRAKQKGLVSKKNTHFQSVDTIGETAVSWTLGKMVIEASKAVKPHGHDPKTIGTHSRWSQAWNVGKGKFGKAIGIPKLEGKLNEYGVDVFWVYLAFLLLIVGIAYSTLRRRFWLTRATIYKRRRSDAGEVRDWMRKRSQVIASEEGSIPSTPRKGLFSTSRFKPLAYRVSSVMSKFARSGRNDSASRSLNGRAAPATGPPSHINLPDRPDAYSTTTSMSLPTSPRNENYFTPAFAETPSGPNHDISLTEVVSHNSPSKSALGLFNGNSRMLNHKPSGSNLRSKRSVPFPMTTTNGDTSSGGWNDPPGAVLNSASEYLGPKAGSALSRSSSRINLEEYGMTGLASRPVSRGPNADDPGGP
jgi:Golgi apyrase